MSNTPRLTATELTQLRASYAQIAAQSERAAALFYQRLFVLNPSLKSLFHGDMREQGRKLISTLGLISSAADRLDELVPSIRQLGIRHATYRVKDVHYATVGTALLEMVQQMMAETYHPSVGEIWGRVYAFLSAQMIDAARHHAGESTAFSSPHPDPRRAVGE